MNSLEIKKCLGARRWGSGLVLAGLLGAVSASAQPLSAEQLQVRPGASSEDARAALVPVRPGAGVRAFAQQALPVSRDLRTPQIDPPTPRTLAKVPRPSLSAFGRLVPSKMALIRLSEDEPAVGLASLKEKLGAVRATELAYGWYAVELPAARAPAEVDALVTGLRGVGTYWPNHAMKLSTLWNDPFLNAYSQPRLRNQWYLHNSGVGDSVYGNDIDIARAWDTTTVNTMYVSRVAVIDTQVDLAHGDRPAYVADCHITASGTCEARRTFHSHGTAVASLIGAASNNGVGMAGVNWAAEIVPIAIDGDDSEDRALESNRALMAIYYAVAQGAKIINASYGATRTPVNSLDNAEYAAIKYAEDRDVLFVAAAGNDKANIESAGSGVTPVGYDLGNIVGVAAVNDLFRLANFSNYGPTLVEIAAPGEDRAGMYDGDFADGIVAAKPGGFSDFKGTSVAAPLVTGVASLMKSLRPEASPYVLQSCLAYQPQQSLVGKLRWPGVISAEGAVNCVLSFGERTPPPPFDIVSPAHTSSVGSTQVTFSWNGVNDAYPRYDLYLDGQFKLRTGGTSVTVSELSEGNHRWFVQASDLYGNWRNSNFEHHFTVNVPPTAVQLPTDWRVYSTPTPRFSWTSSYDNEGVTYDVYIDGAHQGRTTETFFTPAALPDGNHWVRVVACDSRGACTGSQTVSFQVNTQPPTAPVLRTPANGGWANGNLVLSWDPADDATGVQRYSLRVDQADGGSEFIVLPGATISYTASTRPEGRLYAWSLHACDYSGLCGSESSATFRVDLNPPTGLSPVSPTSGSVSSNTSPEFVWTAASDSLSGVARYELRVSNAGQPYTRSFPAGTTRGKMEAPNGLECTTKGIRHSWGVTAFDAAGNTLRTVDVPFTCRITTCPRGATPLASGCPAQP